MAATGSGLKEASSAELGWRWLEDAPLTGTWVWGAEAHPLSAPTTIKTTLAGSLPLAQKADWPPTPCHTALLIHTLTTRQPWSTASRHVSTEEGHGEPSQAPAASRCHCLKSSDPRLGKMVCTQNLLGEAVTHMLPAVPNSCSLSVPEPLSAAR